MKIVTMLFLSIYSHCIHTPHFLGPHDTLLCVLILYLVGFNHFLFLVFTYGVFFHLKTFLKMTMLEDDRAKFVITMIPVEPHSLQ